MIDVLATDQWCAVCPLRNTPLGGRTYDLQQRRTMALPQPCYFPRPEGRTCHAEGRDRFRDDAPPRASSSESGANRARLYCHHYTSLYVLSVPQLDSAFGRASSSKDHAHTLSGLAGSLPPFRSVPPDRTSERISHHLDTFLRSQGNAAGSRQTSTTGLDTGFQAGEPGEAPALLKCRYWPVASTTLQAL